MLRAAMAATAVAGTRFRRATQLRFATKSRYDVVTGEHIR
jgi:hypothetical protein